MISKENQQSAESRIRDVDFAAEMVNYTKEQIIAQAAQSMLTQANMRPQMVLQMFQ
jgi:flagellin